ncbi:MAG: enoyl-CoA hydratase/isomerase family protein [Rhodospirillaceae bacterium]|nr:enoyl-CoA hydratase/isomerase family protein [Rhodospirillaceae bacterium]
MSEPEFVRYEVRDRVAEITLAREPVNAINHQLIEELLAAYARARGDDGVRAIILTSACDKAFSAGMDLKMIRGKSGLDLRRFLEKLYFGMHDAQYRMGKPTIAAVNGPARAAGVTLAVSCDCLIIADDVDISYPEIVVGVIPAMHFVHLPKQIGRHKAFEMLFTGDTMSAPEAERRGLVNYAVPRDQVMAKAREMAAKYASMSPVIMELARDAFMRANDFEYRRAIENTVETICNIINTEDAQEGLNAFAEKRSPNWE